MNKILIFLILLIPSVCFSATRGVPFLPEVDTRFSDLETLSGLEITSAQILVGNASGDGASVAMSGDTTIDNTGAVTIGASKVVNSMMADNSVDSDEYVDGSLDEVHLQVPETNGRGVLRTARATLDCGASSCVAGTVSMVTTLPAKALIVQAWWFTLTQFVDGGAGTVALHCEDADNIFTAADITGNADDSIISGNSTGTAANMVASIAAQCTITATIAVAEQTAGVLNLTVLYTVHD